MVISKRSKKNYDIVKPKFTESIYSVFDLIQGIYLDAMHQIKNIYNTEIKIQVNNIYILCTTTDLTDLLQILPKISKLIFD